MITAKIKKSSWFDLSNAPTDSKWRINLILWYNGSPYDDITLKQLKNMYCADFYCPDDRWEPWEWRIWWTNEYDTKPVLLKDLSHIKYCNEI